ncbi:MAG: hypothetical protein ACUVTQ_10725 [Desulfotomaculales bacterium]
MSRWAEGWGTDPGAPIRRRRKRFSGRTRETLRRWLLWYTECLASRTPDAEPVRRSREATGRKTSPERDRGRL